MTSGTFLGLPVCVVVILREVVDVGNLRDGAGCVVMVGVGLTGIRTHVTVGRVFAVAAMVKTHW